jgi:hypothetical protein
MHFTFRRLSPVAELMYYKYQYLPTYSSKNKTKSVSIENRRSIDQTQHTNTHTQTHTDTKKGANKNQRNHVNMQRKSNNGTRSSTGNLLIEYQIIIFPK